jgi:hypothetical protein
MYSWLGGELPTNMTWYFLQDGSQDEIKLLKGNRSFNPFVLLPPAMCDMVATSVMYIGLTLTYASSFQMLRGVFMLQFLYVRPWKVTEC